MSASSPQESSPPLDFRTAYCRWTGCALEEFEERVLAQTLFLRARIARFFIRPFRSHAFFVEYQLVKQAGDKQEIEDIEIDIDFYQHKYVVGKLGRESFSFRISGRQLGRLARNAFRAARQMEVAEEVRPDDSQFKNRPNPA